MEQIYRDLLTQPDNARRLTDLVYENVSVAIDSWPLTLVTDAYIRQIYLHDYSGAKTIKSNIPLVSQSDEDCQRLVLIAIILGENGVFLLNLLHPKVITEQAMQLAIKQKEEVILSMLVNLGGKINCREAFKYPDVFTTFLATRSFQDSHFYEALEDSCPEELIYPMVDYGFVPTPEMIEAVEDADLQDYLKFVHSLY